MNEETKKRLSETMKEFYKTEDGIAHKEKMKANMVEYWNEIKQAVAEKRSRTASKLSKVIQKV